MEVSERALILENPRKSLGMKWDVVVVQVYHIVNSVCGLKQHWKVSLCYTLWVNAVCSGYVVSIYWLS